MDILTGKILKLNNRPDGKIIDIAKNIAAELEVQGFESVNILGLVFIIDRIILAVSIFCIMAI